MLHTRIVRFDTMTTVALFGKVFGTKRAPNATKFVEHACMATMRYGREIDVVHVM